MRRDKKNKKGKKFGNQNKLTLFQKPEMKFGRSCPLSQKNSPIVDYKNITLKEIYIRYGQNIAFKNNFCKPK